MNRYLKFIAAGLLALGLAHTASAAPQVHIGVYAGAPAGYAEPAHVQPYYVPAPAWSDRHDWRARREARLQREEWLRRDQWRREQWRREQWRQEYQQNGYQHHGRAHQERRQDWREHHERDWDRR